MKKGLPAITDKRPILILGNDLVEFLRRSRRRATCALDECYCLKCRMPRKAAGGLADYTPVSSGGGNLSAICEYCGKMMFKRISSASLASVCRLLEVSVRQADRHLRDSA
jgi:hypothetical protein